MVVAAAMALATMAVVEVKVERTEALTVEVRVVAVAMAMATLATVEVKVECTEALTAEARARA